MKLAVFAMLFAVFMVVKANKCHRQSDCKPDECCVHTSFSFFRGGKCKKLAREGENCSEGLDLADNFGKLHFHYCPCGSSLTCTPERKILGKIRINETCIAVPTVEPETTTQEEIVSETTSQNEISVKTTSQEEIRVEIIGSQEKIIEPENTETPANE